ncbi:MAG TPA: exodeoxyribonuclease VII small subunit [Candidatus Paceibacterota bacterium]|nr:exodeoxyribonuclease VII small subunit [Candidatus Paceibacterota bacterium]
MPKTTEKNDIAKSLRELERIVAWFDEQEQVDVQQGLEKVREGAVLVKELRTRLKEVENEFNEVKKELEDDDE